MLLRHRGGRGDRPGSGRNKGMSWRKAPARSWRGSISPKSGCRAKCRCRTSRSLTATGWHSTNTTRGRRSSRSSRVSCASTAAMPSNSQGRRRVHGRQPDNPLQRSRRDRSGGVHRGEYFERHSAGHGRALIWRTEHVRAGRLAGEIEHQSLLRPDSITWAVASSGFRRVSRSGRHRGHYSYLVAGSGPFAPALGFRAVPRLHPSGPMLVVNTIAVAVRGVPEPATIVRDQAHRANDAEPPRRSLARAGVCVCRTRSLGPAHPGRIRPSHRNLPGRSRSSGRVCGAPASRVPARHRSAPLSAAPRRPVLVSSVARVERKSGRFDLRRRCSETFTGHRRTGDSAASGGQISTKQQGGPKRRLSETAGVDPDGAIELIRDRLPVSGAAHDARQTREIAEAHGEIEGHDGFLPGAERQAEGEVTSRRAAAVEEQCRAQRGETEAKRVRIAHTRPDPHDRAADRSVGARADETDFGRLVRGFGEPRRLNKAAERSGVIQATRTHRSTQPSRRPDRSGFCSWVPCRGGQRRPLIVAPVRFLRAPAAELITESGSAFGTTRDTNAGSAAR